MEIESTLAARRELGPGHDEQLIEGFLQRIEREIDQKVDERATVLREGGHRGEKRAAQQRQPF